MDDGGIDVIGWKIKEHGQKENLKVQCKKQGWSSIKYKEDKYYIGENIIAQFYGKAIDIENINNTRLIFVATKDVPQCGQIFCKKKNIELITYRELVGINKEMNLKEWIEDILTSDISQEEKEKLISKECRERRDLFLQEKEAIIQETKQEILVERTKNIPPEQKNNFHLFVGMILILVIFFCYII